jgi:hypothetical protein
VLEFILENGVSIPGGGQPDKLGLGRICGLPRLLFTRLLLIILLLVRTREVLHLPLLLILLLLLFGAVLIITARLLTRGLF